MCVRFGDSSASVRVFVNRELNSARVRTADVVGMRSATPVKVNLTVFGDALNDPHSVRSLVTRYSMWGDVDGPSRLGTVSYDTGPDRCASGTVYITASSSTCASERNAKKNAIPFPVPSETTSHGKLRLGGTVTIASDGTMQVTCLLMGKNFERVEGLGIVYTADFSFRMNYVKPESGLYTEFGSMYIETASGARSHCAIREIRYGQEVNGDGEMISYVSTTFRAKEAISLPVDCMYVKRRAGNAGGALRVVQRSASLLSVPAVDVPKRRRDRPGGIARNVHEMRVGREELMSFVNGSEKRFDILMLGGKRDVVKNDGPDEPEPEEPSPAIDIRQVFGDFYVTVDSVLYLSGVIVWFVLIGICVEFLTQTIAWAIFSMLE